MFQNQNAMQVFLYECIIEGNQLSSEKLQCHFNFIFPIMPDEVAYVSAVLL